MPRGASSTVGGIRTWGECSGRRASSFSTVLRSQALMCADPKKNPDSRIGPRTRCITTAARGVGPIQRPASVPPAAVRAVQAGVIRVRHRAAVLPRRRAVPFEGIGLLLRAPGGHVESAVQVARARARVARAVAWLRCSLCADHGPATALKFTRSASARTQARRSPRARSECSLGAWLSRTASSLAPRRQPSDASIPAKRSLTSSRDRSEYSIDDQALATYNAGAALVIPPETVHAVPSIGSGRAALLTAYLVEQGKPFLVVVD